MSKISAPREKIKSLFRGGWWITFTLTELQNKCVNATFLIDNAQQAAAACQYVAATVWLFLFSSSPLVFYYDFIYLFIYLDLLFLLGTVTPSVPTVLASSGKLRHFAQCDFSEIKFKWTLKLKALCIKQWPLVFCFCVLSISQTRVTSSLPFHSKCNN